MAATAGSPIRPSEAWFKYTVERRVGYAERSISAAMTARVGCCTFGQPVGVSPQLVASGSTAQVATCVTCDLENPAGTGASMRPALHLRRGHVDDVAGVVRSGDVDQELEVVREAILPGAGEAATGYRLPAARCPQDSRDTAGGWLGLSGRKRDAGSRERFFLERVKGIEPSYRAWEARVLPLNYTRKGANRTRVTGR